ncbi:probable protein phosphatase 2C 72 [Chenopodium quinoa]|uniref:probable protein phosphatase 2C 72 n=1 Tax=Chenopodium quinoa TaxID=63459 RepID=UPI000B785979|nr:probable protein phosphatase 2C 72 [Chenopodium quinoa]
MGNCISCISSDIQVYGDDFHENCLHIVERGHKVGSVHSRRGARGLNQDAAILHEGYGNTEDGVLCALFDGHGIYGHKVSMFVRNQLPALLLNQRSSLGWDEACVVSSFEAMDEQLKQFEHVDSTHSGSTAVVVIKQGADLVIANLGDSRAVLGTITEFGVQATQLTVDLKPDIIAEANRIRDSKGRVFSLENEAHITRIWQPEEDIPGLAMSRAFGDFNMKSYGLIAIPEVFHHRLNSEDHFLVLASDGVWDVLSNEEVVSAVWSAENREAAAAAVTYRAHAAWSQTFPSARPDDCTAICLFL